MMMNFHGVFQDNACPLKAYWRTTIIVKKASLLNPGEELRTKPADQLVQKTYPWPQASELKRGQLSESPIFL